KQETALLHRAEHWRERLLDDGDAALGELLDEYPHADRQKLRQLVRNVLEERRRNRPPRAFRELFRALRDLLSSTAGAAAGDDGTDGPDPLGDWRRRRHARRRIPLRPHRTQARVPPTVICETSSDGWPTPTGTLWPSLPQVPTPSSSARSLPTIATRCMVSGPLPIRVAPLTGAAMRPSSIR